MDKTNDEIRDLIKALVSDVVKEKGQSFTIGYIETVLIDVARYWVSDQDKTELLGYLRHFKNTVK